MIKYRITLYSYESKKGYHREIYYMMNGTDDISMNDYIRFIRTNKVKQSFNI